MLDNEILKRRMDIALSVPIRDILRHEGFTPASRSIRKYHSPFREDDRNPSFFIFEKENRWVDYGLNSSHRSGDAIDLVVRIRGLGFLDAIDYILETIAPGIVPEGAANSLRTSGGEDKSSEDGTKHEILKTGAIHHPALKEYLSYRCIPLSIANQYCRQINYKHISSGRQYFAIGFPNDSGGWAIRTAPYSGNPKGMKMNLLSYGISTIHLKQGETHESAYLFEGFMNFLSWCALFGTPDRDIIVLNSSQNRYALKNIAATGVKDLFCYPDADNEGMAAYRYIWSNSGCTVHDCSAFYSSAGTDDLNEYLMSKKGRL